VHGPWASRALWFASGSDARIYGSVHDVYRKVAAFSDSALDWVARHDSGKKEYKVERYKRHYRVENSFLQDGSREGMIEWTLQHGCATGYCSAWILA
jgi:hypothetical protein